MGTVNLAYPVDRVGVGLVGVFWMVYELYNHPAVGIPVAAVLVIGVIWVGWLWWLGWSENRRQVSGTARVLSFAKTPADQADQRGRRWCRIKLEVHVPGREQYVTVLRKPLGAAEQAAVQPGKTVQVRADPDKPKSVRIDFSQPIT